ncbi:phosphate-starvation-inducible PsiE family protein [Litoribacillus peritrichatus]|uniref:Phosphate-starvation-inducible PsiE family protein n=1 Tax=Litoribacillus peritrichatus TaxID=718191 RepID=A0ABP7MEE8_9GAMM
MKLFEKFEKIILGALLFMMGLLVVAAILEVGLRFFQFLVAKDGFLLNLQEIFTVLGWFLLVLIVLELMASVAAFLKEKVIKVEFMFIVAITAVTRKLVIMDSKETEPFYYLGLAAVILALSIGYFLSKKVTIKYEVKKDASSE